MKKSLYFIGLITLMVIIGLAFISCGGASPSKVVRDYHTAMEKKDQDAIKKLMTEDAANMTIMALGFADDDDLKMPRITNTTETIDGDNATVVVTYADGETESFDLIKVDGKWKITMGK